MSVATVNVTSNRDRTTVTKTDILCVERVGTHSFFGTNFDTAASTLCRRSRVNVEQKSRSEMLFANTSCPFNHQLKNMQWRILQVFVFTTLEPLVHS